MSTIPGQKQHCSRSTSSVSSKTIADTITVTHSMGGLMMAGALANGRCKKKFASSKTTWVSLSAPMTGTMGSDYLQKACRWENIFLKAAGGCKLQPHGAGKVSATNGAKLYSDVIVDRGSDGVDWVGDNDMDTPSLRCETV
ncbi:hypothetical protein PsorP6_002564 [Peronosclerospora sorghi]|uniref:Uncharacterized protein n=1 Tax=Peronosclerospora sorghi TaxID=230839 RepID=A0ACC0WVG9_9STRA|nr:hypothetical protein PsorP6_002564 [Peronosclerospora sorghi]